MKFIYIICLILLVSCSSPRSEQNAENIEHLKVGMRIEEVVDIMGQPDRISILPLDTDRYEFMYTAPFGMSDNYNIYISRQDSTVLYINYGN